MVRFWQRFPGWADDTREQRFRRHDHNTIPSGSDAGFSNTNHGSYLGVGSYGDKSWASADSFGTANNLFFENNIVYSSGDEGPFADNEAGTSMGSVVGRVS